MSLLPCRIRPCPNQFWKKCSDGPKFYMCCTKRKNLLVNKMLDHASMTLFNIDETWSPLPRSQWSQIIYEVLCKYFRFHKIFRHRVACKKLWDWNCFSLSLRWLKIPLGPLRSFNLKTSANWEHIKNSANLMATLTSLIRGHVRLFFSGKKSSLPSDFHAVNWKFHPTR